MSGYSIGLMCKNYFIMGICYANIFCDSIFPELGCVIGMLVELSFMGFYFHKYLCSYQTMFL